MSIVAVAGDCATTTSVALASAWPASDEVLVVEADPRGGDLAAWLDVPESPSLSTIVTRATDAGWPEIDRHSRLTESGLRIVPAPARATAAAQAVRETGRSVVPTLAGLRTPIAIADTGALQPNPAAHPFVAGAAVLVLVHRQATQSARAAAVRLQRLADQLDALAAVPSSLVVAVVGGAPFAVGEIESFLTDSVGAVPVVGLPFDELAAAVFGGRTGVSTRRLARLPLARSARDLAATVESCLGPQHAGMWGAGS